MREHARGGAVLRHALCARVAAVLPWLLALVCLGLASARTHAQGTPPGTVPSPKYAITDNGLGIYGSGFVDPADAGAYIEAEHLKWPWGNGAGLTLYCSAQATRFDKADFLAAAAPSALSAYTQWAGITRNWMVCTASNSNGYCVAWACGADPNAFSYRMRATCPNGWVFENR
jgi:hypothetical protein